MFDCIRRGVGLRGSKEGGAKVLRDCYRDEDQYENVILEMSSKRISKGLYLRPCQELSCRIH